MQISYPVNFNLFQLLLALSEATDLVSPALVNHHRQVSYLAHSLGRCLGLEAADLRDLAMAGALHDIGGLSLASRLETLEFEMNTPERHAVAGALLLAMFKPFRRIADLVRFHHVYWLDGAGSVHKSQPVPRLAHILHLADRIAVLVDPHREILQQSDSIVGQIKNNAGRMFMPDAVAAFEDLAIKESFWLDLAAPSGCQLLAEPSFLGTTKLGSKDLLDLAAMFCQVIDFRSRFTATHSSGVAAVAAVLAGRAGAAAGAETMQIAGLLHDIGKLVVPQEILEKQTALTKEDFVIIRRHPYYSRRILHSVGEFAAIGQWSAFHHERLDGSGYPFHVSRAEIPLEARILAVVDAFIALTEERPYRFGLSVRSTLQILDTMVRHHKLDGDLVGLIIRDVEELNAIREAAQSEAYDKHKKFLADLQEQGRPGRNCMAQEMEKLK